MLLDTLRGSSWVLSTKIPPYPVYRSTFRCLKPENLSNDKHGEATMAGACSVSSHWPKYPRGLLAQGPGNRTWGGLERGEPDGAKRGENQRSKAAVNRVPLYRGGLIQTLHLRKAPTIASQKRNSSRRSYEHVPRLIQTGHNPNG